MMKSQNSRTYPAPSWQQCHPMQGQGHFVYQLMADDADKGSEVRYNLESGRLIYIYDLISGIVINSI